MAVCDICGIPGVGTTVKSDDMRRALKGGFDPFRLELVKLPAALDQGPDFKKLWQANSFEQWKQTVASDTTGWNVCPACLVKVKDYLGPVGTEGHAAKSPSSGKGIPGTLRFNGRDYSLVDSAEEFVKHSLAMTPSYYAFRPDDVDQTMRSLTTASQWAGVNPKTVFEPVHWVCTRCARPLLRDVAFLFWTRNKPNAPKRVEGGKATQKQIDTFARTKQCPHCRNDAFAYLTLSGGTHPADTVKAWWQFWK